MDAGPARAVDDRRLLQLGGDTGEELPKLIDDLGTGEEGGNDQGQRRAPPANEVKPDEPRDHKDHGWDQRDDREGLTAQIGKVCLQRGESRLGSRRWLRYLSLLLAIRHSYPSYLVWLSGARCLACATVYAVSRRSYAVKSLQPSPSPGTSSPLQGATPSAADTPDVA